MGFSISFVEMIQITIRTDFQLQTNMNPSSFAIGFSNCCDDSLQISIPVHGPLIQGTYSHSHVSIELSEDLSTHRVHSGKFPFMVGFFSPFCLEEFIFFNPEIFMLYEVTQTHDRKSKLKVQNFNHMGFVVGKD